jgi:hypothetical protein
MLGSLVGWWWATLLERSRVGGKCSGISLLFRVRFRMFCVDGVWVERGFFVPGGSQDTVLLGVGV